MEVDKEVIEEGKEKLYTSDIRKGILPSKTRGRGHKDAEERDADNRYAGNAGIFEGVSGSEQGSQPGMPCRSIEGWIVIVNNIHEEAQEPDVRDVMAEFGAIKNIHLNYDRRTGFTKGYALVEYEKKEEAEKAVKESDIVKLAGKPLNIDWAFIVGQSSNPNSDINIRTSRSGASHSSFKTNFRHHSGGHDDRGERRDRGDRNDRGGRRRR